MPHPTGQRLRCESCGAEILFVKPCPCPEREPKTHADVCCGEQMQLVEAGETAAEPSGEQPGA